ncbi:unnamed protein product [Camellia sinensis]
MASVKADKPVGTQLFGQAKKEPAVKSSDGAYKVLHQRQPPRRLPQRPLLNLRRSNRRAISVGKPRGSRSSTPVPSWRTMAAALDSPKYAPLQSGGGRSRPVSARKLAATLWEMNEAPSPRVGDNLEEKKAVKREMRVRERMGVPRSVHSGSLPPHLSDPSHSPISEVLYALRSATPYKKITGMCLEKALHPAKRSQTPLPSQVNDDRIILDKTLTDQVSIWKSSRGLTDKVVLDHDCFGETFCDDTYREVVLDPTNELLVCTISGHCFDRFLSPAEMEPDTIRSSMDQASSTKAPNITIDGEATDIAGEVVEVRSGVTKFKAGDKVVAVLSHFVVDVYALIGDVSGLAEKIQSFFVQESDKVMTNQEAVECIRNIKDAKAAAKHLTC